MKYVLVSDLRSDSDYRTSEWESSVELIEADSLDSALTAAIKWLSVDSADHYEEIPPRLYRLEDDASEPALWDAFCEHRKKVLAHRARLADEEKQRRREARESALRREIEALESGAALADAKSRLEALLREKGEA